MSRLIIIVTLASGVKTMNKLNEQDIAVAEYLKSISIPFNALNAGVKNDDNWQADSFLVSIQNERFDYHMGIGHRLKLKNGRLTLADQKYVKQLKEIVYDNHSRSVVNDLKNGYASVKPTSASVLYCLLSDANALDTSFKYWCDDYGYDNDSISALNTYNACCVTGEKIHKIFTHEQRVKLAELLEDY